MQATVSLGFWCAQLVAGCVLRRKLRARAMCLFEFHVCHWQCGEELRALFLEGRQLVKDTSEMLCESLTDESETAAGSGMPVDEFPPSRSVASSAQTAFT